MLAIMLWSCADSDARPALEAVIKSGLRLAFKTDNC